MKFIQTFFVFLSFLSILSTASSRTGLESSLQATGGCFFSLDSTKDPTLSVKCQEGNSFTGKLNTLISVDANCKMNWIYNTKKSPSNLSKLQGNLYVQGGTIICEKGKIFNAIDINIKEIIKSRNVYTHDDPFFYKKCTDYSIDSNGVLKANCLNHGEKTLNINRCVEQPLGKCDSNNGGLIKCNQKLNIIRLVTYDEKSKLLTCPNIKYDINKCELEIKGNNIYGQCEDNLIVDVPAKNLLKLSEDGFDTQTSRVRAFFTWSHFDQCFLRYFIFACKTKNGFKAIDIRQYITIKNNKLEPFKVAPNPNVNIEKDAFYHYCNNYYVKEGNLIATCNKEEYLLDLRYTITPRQDGFVGWNQNPNQAFPFSNSMSLDNGVQIMFSPKHKTSSLIRSIVFDGTLHFREKQSVSFKMNKVQDTSELKSEKTSDISKCTLAYFTPER